MKFAVAYLIAFGAGNFVGTWLQFGDLRRAVFMGIVAPVIYALIAAPFCLAALWLGGEID